jgi:hypothetical protein
MPGIGSISNAYPAAVHVAIADACAQEGPLERRWQATWWEPPMSSRAGSTSRHFGIT